MTARHQVSQAAYALIMRFEGYRRDAARLADGRWTIGYGHTVSAREGAQVSHEDAEALLIYDVQPIAAAINTLTYTPLTQNQFDALVAFAFNVGLDSFRRSAVLRRVNEGNLIQAAFALEMWRKADFEGEPIVVDALVRRRAAEKTLFLTPQDGWVPSPSPVLRPRVDSDADLATPRAPVELDTPLTGDMAEARRAPPAPWEKSASLAAAEAVTARLSEILPDPAPEPEIIRAPETIAAPEPTAAPMTPAEPAPVVIPDPQSEPAPDLDAKAAVAESAEPEQGAADVSALFGALFASPRQPAGEAPRPLAEPPAAPSPISLPLGLSRQVVWREAPVDASPSPAPKTVADSVPLPALAALFLTGLAVFAGGIVWGMKAAGSTTVSWVLGLVGIACVVTAVYIYLDRLGRREE